MSATLCDLDNECGQGLLLEMGADCRLNLTVLSRPCDETWLDIANFLFTSDEVGCRKAKDLIEGLEEWLNHRDFYGKILNPPIAPP